MKTTRLLFTIHGWTGLLTGVFLLLLGLSGSALVFMKEQDQWLNRKLLTVKSVKPKLPLDSLYGIITVRHPRLDGIAWMNPEAAGNEACNFRLYMNDGKLATYDLGIVTLDPYTGKVLREGRYDQLQSGFMQWLLQFHFSFHLGIPGAAFTGLVGLAMLLSIGTGIAVYRKFIWRVLRFRVPVKWKNWRKASSDLHRVVGVWSLLLNAVIFFTGFWMNLFAFESSVWQGETVGSPPNRTTHASFDRMLKRVYELMPGIRLSYVYLPTQPEKDFSANGQLPGDWDLFGSFANSVSMDGQSGKVTSVHTLEGATWAEKLEGTVGPLHYGTFGGIAVKILYVLIGLTPGLLSITGFLLWMRRNKKRLTGKSATYSTSRLYNPSLVKIKMNKK